MPVFPVLEKRGQRGQSTHIFDLNPYPNVVHTAYRKLISGYGAGTYAPTEFPLVTNLW